MLSSIIRSSLYGTLLSVSLISLSTGVSAAPADGVFGDYFRNIISTPCSPGTTITGYIETPGTTYGTRICKNVALLLSEVPGNISIASTPTANIGIGTPTPTAKLDILGNIKIKDGTQGAGKVLVSDADGLASWMTAIPGQLCSGNGSNNTCYGTNVGMRFTTGFANTANGTNALYSNTTGFANTANGNHSLFSNITGNYNSTLGSYAGSSITTGSSNIAIGYNAQVPSSTASNQLSIGNWIYGSGGDIGIGTNSPTTRLDVSGIVKAVGYLYSSDIRLKSDIMAIDAVDNKINAINGVTFRWKDTGKMDMGFIAQDIEKVLPEIVHTDTKGMKSVEYANITALLIEGYKYQKTRADSLEARVSALEKASK